MQSILQLVLRPVEEVLYGSISFLAPARNDQDMEGDDLFDRPGWTI